MLALVAVLLLSYLVGSVPSAVWVGRAMHGVDVRQHGSGNAGATNVFRVLGFKAGVVVLLLDFAKGWFAVGVVSGLWPLLAGADPTVTVSPGEAWTAWGTPVRLLCAVAAILGHSFPVFASFRGGKGVATSAGVLLALTPGAFVVTVTAFLAALFGTRYVAVASLTAAVVYPATLFAMHFALGWPVPAPLLVVGAAMGAWLFWTHRTNIRRLRSGEESKVKSFRPRRRPETLPDLET